MVNQAMAEATDAVAGEGEAGVKIYNEKENAGSFGGKWIHIELEPEFAKDAAKMEAAWRALPKPGA